MSLCSGTTIASYNVRSGSRRPHELTRAVANTDDFIYGCASDQALSDADAVRNAGFLDRFEIIDSCLY
ncbi:hypothetical protein FB451DRAFT_1391695 [Mycena latifolia]|nr:hypothetical protein FB451DRAFT_1391695 [Mycena latifolia]